MSETKHTATPWFWVGDTLMGKHGEQASIHILDVGELETAVRPSKKDKERIVHCVNSHNALVESLEKISEHAYDDDTPQVDILEDFDNMRAIAHEVLNDLKNAQQK